MSISVTTRISGSLEVFSLPTSLESLQERGIVRDESDFLTNSTNIVTDSSVPGILLVPDGSDVEGFNTAARALLDAIGYFGNELSYLYKLAYGRGYMETDKLALMPDEVRQVCNAVSHAALAEFYINKGEYGDMPDGLRKWLDLNAMGESLEGKYHLIRGVNGFYEVKK